MSHRPSSKRVQNRFGRTACGLVVWISLAAWFPHPAAAQKIYWSDRTANTVRRANLDGSDVETLVSGLVEIRGVALDLHHGKIYWADNGSNKIQRANLDGTDVEDLVTTGLNFPAGIVLDVSRQQMYWADNNARRIQRANFDGTGVVDLVTGLVNPYFITLDPVSEYLYWTDQGADKVQRADLDGANVVDIITTGLSTPRGVTIDQENQKLVWGDRGTDKIQRSNFDGTDIEDLVQIPITGGDSAIHGVALDVAQDAMYWVDNGYDKIQRSRLDGTGVVDLLTVESGLLENPWQIVLDLRTPGTPNGCDFDSDGDCDAVDFDMLSREVQRETHNSFYNLNSDIDSLVTAEDRRIWVEELMQTHWGDANLDGIVDAADLARWEANRFQDGTGWGRGDFNGDGRTDVKDFNLWNKHKSLGRLDADSGAQPDVVPEPSTLVCMWSILVCFTCRRPATAISTT